MKRKRLRNLKVWGSQTAEQISLPRPRLVPNNSVPSFWMPEYIIIICWLTLYRLYYSIGTHTLWLFYIVWELTLVVSRRTVQGANVYSFICSIAIHADAQLLGIFPNDLREVASFHGESGIIVIVIFDFIVPHFCCLRGCRTFVSVGRHPSQVFSDPRFVRTFMVDSFYWSVVFSA